MKPRWVALDTDPGRLHRTYSGDTRRVPMLVWWLYRAFD